MLLPFLGARQRLMTVRFSLERRTCGTNCQSKLEPTINIILASSNPACHNSAMTSDPENIVIVCARDKVKKRVWLV